MKTDVKPLFHVSLYRRQTLAEGEFLDTELLCAAEGTLKSPFRKVPTYISTSATGPYYTGSAGTLLNSRYWDTELG